MVSEEGEREELGRVERQLGGVLGQWQLLWLLEGALGQWQLLWLTAQSVTTQQADQ